MAVIKLFPLSFPVVNMKLSIALTSVGNEWLPCFLIGSAMRKIRKEMGNIACGLKIVN